MQIGEERLIDDYIKILHIFNTTKYENYVNTLKLEANLYGTIYIHHELDHISNQLKGLKVTSNRQKRGLINIFGKGLRYLYGTMDDDDRQEIESKLTTIGENNHNIIEQTNRQVKINSHFDDQLTNLTELHNEQTKLLIQQSKTIKDINNRLTTRDRLEPLKYQINYIGKIIEKTRELILMSKLRTLNRDILTDEEIKSYNITLEKMENIEMDLATYNENIIFIIKIPQYNEELFKIIYIQPVPNKLHKQIIIENKKYLTNKRIIYEYTNKIKELIEVKEQCIQYVFKEGKMKCNYENFEKTKIVEIETNIIVLINVNQIIEHNCNQYPLELRGIYALQIENCKVKIDKWYDKRIHQNSMIIQNPLREIEIQKGNVTLEELNYSHIENTKIIKEIKVNQKVHNGTLYFTIFILISAICIIIYFKFKRRKVNDTKVSINLSNIPLETGVSSSSGDVMTNSTHKLPFA